MTEKNSAGRVTCGRKCRNAENSSKTARQNHRAHPSSDSASRRSSRAMRPRGNPRDCPSAINSRRRRWNPAAVSGSALRRFAGDHARAAAAGDLEPAFGGQGAIRLGHGVEVNSQIRAQAADRGKLHAGCKLAINQQQA